MAVIAVLSCLCLGGFVAWRRKSGARHLWPWGTNDFGDSLDRAVEGIEKRDLSPLRTLIDPRLSVDGVPRDEWLSQLQHPLGDAGFITGNVVDYDWVEKTADAATLRAHAWFVHTPSASMGDLCKPAPLLWVAVEAELAKGSSGWTAHSVQYHTEDKTRPPLPTCP